jgi:hypothetical protein
MPGVEKGLLPGRAAVGRGETLLGSVGEEKGLLPGRGGRGIVTSVGASATTGVAGTGGALGITGAIGTTGTAGTGGALSTSAGVSTAAAFLAAADFAGAFLTGTSVTGAAGYNSRILRTTGGSTVDDADRTNSPNSWSFTRTTLLSMPSSFASS